MSILPGITDESFATGLEFVDSSAGLSSLATTEHEITLEPMHELILELDTNEEAKLTINDGISEIFGVELANDTKYNFKGAMKLLVFTFKGSQLSLQGVSDYKVSKEPLMNVYLSLHLTLENQRAVVSQLNQTMSIKSMSGPRVLVLGTKNSGKSVLSRILSSYAMRLDRQVMLVNLNPQSPMFVCPGLLTATPISDLLNVENINFGETETTGSNFYHPKQPLVKNFGLEDANDNVELYKKICSNISDIISQRIDNDLDVCNSGVILDAPSNLSDELANFIIEIFKINIVVQIDKETSFNKKDLKTITINKSTNIIEQSDQYIRQIQQRSIREYFYGIDKLSLSPYTITVNYADFKVFKPINTSKNEAKQEEEEEQLDPYFISVEINSSNINNSILSVPKSEDKISCHGFVCVLSCDDDKHKCRILLPTPSNSLPNNIFVLTDFRYYE